MDHVCANREEIKEKLRKEENNEYYQIIKQKKNILCHQQTITSKRGTSDRTN